VPRTCSRLNTSDLAPITLMNRKIAKTVKRLQRKIVKFTELELYVRDDIVRKKIRIFRQQRHLTKKTMYNEDQYEGMFALCIYIYIYVYTHIYSNVIFLCL
jgi:hypothetical protein